MRHRLRQSAAAGRGADRKPLERAALLAARTLVDRMRALYRELERQTDAPITLHRALNYISENPGMTASNLATALGMQRPAVSHTLKGLAERGWIERRRHASDQRSVRLHVTAPGEHVIGATAGRAVGTLQRCVRNLSPQELRGLAVGLDALLINLPPPPSTKKIRRYQRASTPRR